jgi:YidC/Oxa1 family membrane protein insertase
MSNIITTVQQVIAAKIHDPEKIKEVILAEIEAKRSAKKEKKKLIVQTADGGEAIEVSEAELVKIRLAKARELDAKRYGEDQSSDDEEKE